MRLPPPLRRDVLVRSALIWLGVRFALAFFQLVVYGPVVAVGVVAVVVAILLADTRASHETVLVANLGFSGRHLAVWACAAAGFLEATSQFLRAFVGWMGGGAA